MYIFPADLSAAQRRSILGHTNFRDSDWSANNPQPSSEPIGESYTLLGDMLLVYVLLSKNKESTKWPAKTLFLASYSRGEFRTTLPENAFCLKYF